MWVWISQSVDMSRLSQEAKRGFQEMRTLFSANDCDLFVTSTYGGKHGASSRHYCDDAWDQLPSAKITVEKMKLYLGDDFDVINEGDHIHVEYDPK